MVRVVIGLGVSGWAVHEPAGCYTQSSDVDRSQKFVEFRTPCATYWRIVSLRPGKVDRAR